MSRSNLLHLCKVIRCIHVPEFVWCADFHCPNKAGIFLHQHTLAFSPPLFMVGMAEIELDKLTGQVTVLDYTAVVDCGIPINPAPAIAHAIYRAAGVWHRELPITPEKIAMTRAEE